MAKGQNYATLRTGSRIKNSFSMKKNTFKYYYNLIKEFSWADFKLKYYGSILGLFWSFLKPFLMLFILYIVFGLFFKSGIKNFHIYLLLGIAIWNFFADGTKAGLQTIASKKNIMQNVKISPLAVVTSAIWHSFWTFIITLVVFFIIFFASGLTLGVNVVFLLYFVFLLLIFVLGTSFLITPLHMKFRDFEHIWDVLIQMLFWLSPIVYAEKLVSSSYLKWYMLNPLSRIVVDMRNIVIYQFLPEPKQIVITTVLVLTIFFVGLHIFKKHGRALLENL